MTKKVEYSDITSERLKLTMMSVCLYALEQTGGGSGFVESEVVGVTVFELYPARFGLRRYPQYPDMDAIRVTLTDLKKDRSGKLVEGDKRRGWKITQPGLDWLAENRKAVKEALDSRHPKEARIAPGKFRSSESIKKQFEKRVITSTAFRKWNSGQKPSVYDFHDVMRVDRYTPEHIYRDHLTELAISLKDSPQLAKFLRDMDEEYRSTYRKVGGDSNG